MKPHFAFVPLTPALLFQVLATCATEAANTPTAYAVMQSAAHRALEAPADWSGVMLAGRRPIMAAGVWPLWPGRAEAWLVAVDGIDMRERLAGLEAVRERLDQLQARHPELRRIEMWTAADAPGAASFAGRLGMRIEGVARHWAPDGADYALCSRIAGEATA